MYKLFNENQNKNNLEEEYNKLIKDYSFSKKLSIEESRLILYEEFTNDIISFLTYNIEKICNLCEDKGSSTNKSYQKDNIDQEKFLKAFIDKFFNILEMNSLITSNFDYFELLYTNIALLINEENEEFIYVLFFKLYIYSLKESKELFNYYRDKINRTGLLIKQVIKSIEDREYSDIDYSILYKKITNVFISRFLPDFLNFFMELTFDARKDHNNICTFDLIYNFLFYFENIINEISIKYYQLYDINWRKNFYIQINKLLFNNNKIKDKNDDTNTFNSTDVDRINDILIQKNFSVLNKIFSLLYFNENIFEEFFYILIKAIEKYLIKFISEEEDFFNKIMIVYNIEKELFNISNINFFFNDKNINVINEYHKLIFNIFSKDKNNSINEIMVNSLDSIIRKTENESEIKIKSNIFFKYIDIIPEFENFESLYIHSLIKRSVDDIYDYIKEKQFIDDIVAYSTQMSFYSYKLQTIINSIKRKNVSNLKDINYNFSFTIIPFHCYYLYNLGCKPNISDNLLINFNNVIKELKLPENVKPIFQQGYITFEVNKKYNILKDIIIKSDPLQYTILKFMGLKEKKFDDIKSSINLSDDLGRFILNEMIQYNLVIYNETDDSYTINKNYKIMNNKSMIDIRINYKYFFEGKLNFNINKYHKKLGLKHQEMILQCYIVKYLKCNNSENKNCSFKDIFEYLQNNLPLIAMINLGNDELNKILNTLVEKGFINSKQIKNNILYSYS